MLYAGPGGALSAPSGSASKLLCALSRILALEVAEERLVMAALDAGLEVHRRVDASPCAILYAEEEAAAPAVAAE
jgi:hypothetical protein